MEASFPEADLYDDDYSFRPSGMTFEQFSAMRDEDDIPLEFSSEELKELKLRNKRLATAKAVWKHNHPPHGKHLEWTPNLRQPVKP